MNTNTRTLIDKLQRLPSDRQAEVEDFVEFLEKRTAQARSAAAVRLGEAFSKLDALNESSPSPEEIEAESDAARRARADRR